MRGAALAAMLMMVGPFAMAEDLPIPPIPPVHQFLTEAAPVPNVDAAAPVAPASDKTTVYMRLYRNRMYDPSVGFVPGSRFQTAEDRKPIQTPGFSVSVPLQ
jgi:hypothetical protein